MEKQNSGEAGSTEYIADPLWTVDDVALYLRLKPSTVRKMARENVLPGFKVGKSWRFHSARVKQFAENNQLAIES